MEYLIELTGSNQRPRPDTDVGNSVASASSYIFPLEIWLLFLGHADYSTLKKVERVCKTFQHIIRFKELDAVLFRISATSLSTSHWAPVRHHPFLKSLGERLDMWYYKLNRIHEALFATPRATSRKSKNGPVRNATTRLLDASIMADSAFWPPARGRPSGVLLNMTVMKRASSMRAMKIVQAQSVSHHYVTVGDVVRTILNNTGSLKLLKDLDIDRTCIESAKFVGLRVARVYPFAELDFDWMIVKDTRPKSQSDSSGA